ncbi:phosphonate metabolism protein/1,5-bisphosphokinase (PRPP-forming) PhnN [Actibacterium ureilyticum]|uniref:phosphonate metabolism protein/1,5-bisphosphokinase (PRPP-forming) PhnN n=1 Tax=Actibacterium ureilyticum TaxID=1590614 RepID=UPI000BAB23AE|nr:phosphonate metabolism protein/1,5-bisphosphokinase (PRPP-forming) PhnN [Actibacterium ureilyticum]
MSGALFAVVGPSGVGKDTLMTAAAARSPAVKLVRRVITRPADAGGEDFEAVGMDAFARRRDAGEFVLHWGAHGLFYGIPRGIERDLAAARLVLFNGSRGIMPEAQRRFPDLIVLHVTAPVPVLAERLAARGRESADDIAARLTRAGYDLPPGLNVRTICNDRDLDSAVDAFLAALQPVRA